MELRECCECHLLLLAVRLDLLSQSPTFVVTQRSRQYVISVLSPGSNEHHVPRVDICFTMRPRLPS